MADITVINNIPFTSYEVSGDFEGFNLNVKPTSGAIVTSPAPQYINFESGSYEKYEFDKVDAGEASTVWGFIPDPIDKPVYIVGSNTEAQQVDITNNISGDCEVFTCYDGSVCRIVVYARADGGFAGMTASYKKTDGTETTKEFTTDTNVAVVEIPDADVTQGITLTGGYGKTYTVDNYMTHCTVQGLKNAYMETDTIDVTLTADDGYVFAHGDGITPPQMHAGAMLEEEKIPFTFEENSKTAHLTQDMASLIAKGYDTFFFEGTAVVGEEPPTGSNYGAINVYVMTNDDLEKLAQQRFYEQQDSANYVNRLKRIFAEIPTSGQANIQLGNNQTDITVDTPAEQVLTLDFGTITAPAHNGDSTDYESDMQIFIPFHGYVDLSADYAGKQISLTCVLDIITGQGVAKLTCDGIMFAAYDIEPSQDVIYRTVTQQVNTYGADSWSNKILYGTEPFLHCKWYTSLTVGRGATQYRAKIGTLNGFNVLGDITPITTPEMLTEEQRSIYTALQRGVYVE